MVMINKMDELVMHLEKHEENTIRITFVQIWFPCL